MDRAMAAATVSIMQAVRASLLAEIAARRRYIRLLDREIIAFAKSIARPRRRAATSLKPTKIEIAGPASGGSLVPPLTQKPAAVEGAGASSAAANRAAPAAVPPAGPIPRPPAAPAKSAKSPPVAPRDRDASAIAEFIARRGVTQCPTRYLAETINAEKAAGEAVDILRQLELQPFIPLAKRSRVARVVIAGKSSAARRHNKAKRSHGE